MEYDPIFTATDPDPAKLLKFLSYWKAGGENDATEEDGRGEYYCTITLVLHELSCCSNESHSNCRFLPGVRDTREHLATLVTPGSEVSPLPFDTGPRKHV
ncbi:MAG: hypothetical protein ACPIOQ_28795 [Promethearchaeia archaeon]